MLKHWKYLSYVIRHKYFVFVAGVKVGASWWRLLIHDWSKFLPCEWFPYVRHFYGKPQPPNVGDRVMIHCIDGFGGPAIVLKIRPGYTPYLVQMEDRNPSASFWAHCFEYRGKIVDESFDRAWLHHQKLNPHHWQYWILREDSGATKLMPMPEKYVRELVADWMGAGRAITGKWEAAAWYMKNREKIELAPSTRVQVETLLALRDKETK